MTRLVSGVALAATALVAIRFLPLLPLRVLACLVAAVLSLRSVIFTPRVIESQEG